MVVSQRHGASLIFATKRAAESWCEDCYLVASATKEAHQAPMSRQLHLAFLA